MCLYVRMCMYDSGQENIHLCIFEQLCQKLTEFNNFWYNKYGENLTQTSYTLVQLTCQM